MQAVSLSGRDVLEAFAARQAMHGGGWERRILQLKGGRWS